MIFAIKSLRRYRDVGKNGYFITMRKYDNALSLCDKAFFSR